MWTSAVFIVVGATFLLAGTVKGVVGLGLPLISLAILTVVLDLKSAMALLLFPSLVTNLWQAVTGGAFTFILRRSWSLLLAACATTWFGVSLLALADARVFSALLGASLCVYSALNLSRLRVPAPGRWEPFLSPLVGGLNGVLTGMTGSCAVPGVPYLQALGLQRDVLVQAMGVLFTVSTVALAVSLRGQRLLSSELALLSIAAVVPALVGMGVGRQLRRRLSEAAFRTVLFAALLALGGYIGVEAAGWVP